MPVPIDREVAILYATGHACPLWFPGQGWPVGARFWRYLDDPLMDWQEIPLGERPKLEPCDVPDNVRQFHKLRKLPRAEEDDGDRLQTRTIDDGKEMAAFLLAKPRTKRQKRAAKTGNLFGRKDDGGQETRQRPGGTGGGADGA